MSTVQGTRTFCTYFAFDRSTSHGFYSGDHFRCHYIADNGWFMAMFDDSHWSNARPAAYDETFNTDGFDANASPMWYFDNTIEYSIFCRAKLCNGGQTSSK